jgi:tetratricopeptide (TPR) repeat protein
MIEAHNNLGLAYFQLGQTEQAIAEYEQALRYYPHYALAHANLGNALQRQGHLREAIAEYRQALQTDPYNHDAIENLRRLKVLPNRKE